MTGPGGTADPAGTADPGSTADPGTTADPSSTAGPADTPDRGGTADPGRTPDPGSTADPGRTPDPGSTAGPGSGVTGRAQAANSPGPNEPISTTDIADPDVPVRVTTLELFFDLVFAFTLTQLASLLEHHLRPSGAFEVLLVFGVLWWMYGGYAWLTNARAPTRTVDRLLLLAGMAGFLICGLAIPRGFGPGDTDTRVALGVGYLIVVLVHSGLFYRVNRNVVRVTPFNVTAALLIIAAGFTDAPVSYALWAAAVAVQWLSPLIVQPGGRFEFRPAHFAERHGALVIVALGESVAAIGIGAAPAGVTFAVALTAVLGLALSAVLWWTYFGDGDDARAEQAMAATDRSRQAGLALATYYAHVPILLGVVTLAAGASLTIGNPTRPHLGGEAVAIAGGAALFLAGTAWFRWALHIGPVALRLAGAGFALATAAIGATVNAEAQLAVLLAGIVVMLVAERYARVRPGIAARG